MKGTRRRRHSERGATAVLVAVLIVVMLGMLGLALNVGHLFSVRGEMQNAVDAAAFAGARQLDGTGVRLQVAVNAAGDFATQHETDSTDPVTLTAVGTANAAPVVLGTWNRATRAFTPVTLPTGASTAELNLIARNINAVRTSSQQNEGNWLNTFLGAGEQTPVASAATAVSGGPCQVSCDTAPVVMRSACLYDAQNALRCGQEYGLGLSNANVDAAGLTDLIPIDIADVQGNPSSNTNDICDALQEDPAETCTLNAQTGYLKTTNGNQISANCDDESTNRIKEKICTWFKEYGPADGVLKTITIPIIEYPNDNEPNECTGGSYGGVAQIVGFAYFEVLGVWCKNDPGAVENCGMYATDQCIRVRLTCEGAPPPAGPGGCGWFGISPVPPSLVQ